jgi:GNAT superfamily N-acetyltransferase
MKIIPYEEKYRKDVQNICIATGSSDNLVNPEHYRFTLAFYCDPYLDAGKAFLLEQDEKICGYILCCPDWKTFQPAMKPYLEKIRKECPHFVQRTDCSAYERYAEQYPAHLHIDILEGYTGNGSGTALMNTLIDWLKKQGTAGIMTGAAKDNPRAVGFYHHCGFRTLEEDEVSCLLGRRICVRNLF